MRISKTEINLRRLLAAVPQQTNRCKLVHHVATLKKLLATLKNETAESSSSHIREAKAELYSRSIEEVAYRLEVNKTEDVWESMSSEIDAKLSGQSYISDGVRELSHGPSTSNLPLFPSCLKRKYSPSAELPVGPEFEESEDGDLQKVEADVGGKKICLNPNEYVAKTYEGLMHLEHEAERVGKVRQEYGQKNVAHTTFEPSHLEHELEIVRKIRLADRRQAAKTSCNPEQLEHGAENTGTVNVEDNREDEIEHLDDDARLYVRQHRSDQEKIVNEMLILAKQIKEGSLLLGSSLSDTKELLRSSDLSIRHCLSATTSAHLKTGELITQTLERECGCVTWLSLLIMYFTFVTLIIYIRVT